MPESANADPDRHARSVGASVPPLIPGAEDRWRTLVEQLPAVVYIDAMDDRGTTVYISPQVEELLGYPLEAWAANPGIWFDVLHPDDRDEVFDAYMTHRATSDRWTMEYRAQRTDGRTVWIREDDQIIRDEDGVALAVQGVMLDISQQKADEQRLRELDRTKQALLHAVSHDLRGPLTAVLGAVTLMDSEQVLLSAEDRQQLIEGMQRSARRMDRIVDNLLDMDRLEQGTIESRPTWVDLNELVERVIARLPIPPERSVERRLTSVRVWADAGLLEEIVENLVLNALKHTPQQASVWIWTRADEEGGLLGVDDDGPGVPEELRDVIFEPYRRAAEAHVAGAGIGLSLVRRFAELLGGRAWVQDRDGGPGASFRIAIPPKAVEAEAAPS